MFSKKSVQFSSKIMLFSSVQNNSSSVHREEVLKILATRPPPNFLENFEKSLQWVRLHNALPASFMCGDSLVWHIKIVLRRIHGAYDCFEENLGVTFFNFCIFFLKKYQSLE